MIVFPEVYLLVLRLEENIISFSQIWIGGIVVVVRVIRGGNCRSIGYRTREGLGWVDNIFGFKDRGV